MIIKVTASPILVVAHLKRDESTTVDQIVEAVTADAKRAIEIAAEQPNNPYAVMFVEVYPNDVYDDELSFEVTNRVAKALNYLQPSAIQRSEPRAIEAAKYMPNPKKTKAAKASKRVVEAKPKAPKAVGEKGKSRAEMVREIIREHATLGHRANAVLDNEKIVPIVVERLGMKLSQAKVYVAENREKALKGL